MQKLKNINDMINNNHPKVHFLLSLLVIFSGGFTSGKSVKINSLSDYLRISGSFRSGDTVVWASGTYSNINWTINTAGIIVLAQKPGSVIFEGSSSVKIESDSVGFSGFQFREGSISGDVVAVSGSHNRISEINIDHYNSHYYFHIRNSGQYNLVENCNFENKPPAPPGKEGTSVMQIAVDSLHPGYNHVRFCSFQNHTAPPNSGGDYGMEALRIGYSFQSRFISRTVVEYCWFSRCNGDGEVISSKARENIYRYNTFENNGESHLTLRHGSDNVVYGNFFLGGAGVRIKEGQNQMVYNNYFNTGRFWAIKLENYKVDPLDTIVITYNTFYGSGPLNLGGKGDFPPAKVQISDNLFIKSSASVIENMTGRENSRGNVMIGMKVPDGLKGFYSVQSGNDLNGAGFFQPATKIRSREASGNQALIRDIPVLDDDPLIGLDIMENGRKSSHKTAGCFEPGKKSKPLQPYVTSRNTGPGYLRLR